MQNQITKTLLEIFRIISINDKLTFANKNLFDYSDAEIITPVGNMLPLLFEYKSNLPNQPINYRLLQELMDKLNQNHSLIRLNHIGFCYHVKSQKDEKARLINLIKQTKFHMYEEKSNDQGLWLFMGDTNNWEDPMVELVPVESTNDKWVDYWLPHIQIDIDTTLTADEIENIVKVIFQNTYKPYRFTIDGTVYFIRNYLGILDGINFNLDLATKSRNVRLIRQSWLNRID
jgi:hypothetical protein